ncbi:MAG TPA: sulfite exporter TauE/SafE family protein [Acidobacteriaceae bacterium]|jgi:uncharacterized membrane protein YfcA|nr:sulfite exporter TauE/SafE family protein [Acidobacteriaceae bacterium]
MLAEHLSLPLLRGAWLLVAAFLAGAINAMAGGGSFLSFPAMLGVGVPPIQANATNTVALWPGQAISIHGFRRDLADHTHLLWPVILAGGLGGTAGAIVLLHTGQSTFLHLIPWLLLVAAILFWISGPLGNWIHHRSESSRPRQSKPLLFVCLTIVCFYIGYFGAGAGFLIMAILGLFGVQNINEINALKVIGTTLANGLAVITFIFSGAVVWRHCLAAMLMAAAGGFFGAKLARRIDDKILRSFVVVLGFAMAAYFFWRLK